MLAFIEALCLSSVAAEPTPADPASTFEGSPGAIGLSAHDPDRQRLQLQLDELRERRDNIEPLVPLLVLGAGVVAFVVGTVMFANNICLGEHSCPNINDQTAVAGATAAGVGLLLIPVGLIWWIADVVIRGNLSGQINVLEGQMGQRSSGMRELSPRGFALSVPF
jgi:hypothetical protein